MKEFLVLVMLSCTFFVVCLANQQEYETIEKALESLSNVVVKYKSEFDRKVKFAELQEAIDAIGTSMLGYQGIARNKLDQLRTLNSAARLTYQDCVGPVFEWCVSINSTFDIFIPYISDESLTANDKGIIWDMTVAALSDGQNKTANSLELLKVVQNKTTDLKNLLDAMLDDLHYDFSPSGVYGKQKQELTNAIKTEKERIEKAEKALIIAGVISAVFFVIQAIALGPIGAALAIVPMLTSLGLAVAVRKDRVATYEEQLRVIQAFFNIIDEKIDKASKIATQVNEDLEEDKNNLYKLKGLINAADRDKKLLLMSSPTLRARLVPSFRNLGKACYEYTMWHGYGSEGYKHKHARAKRHATETCKAQRLKAMKMIAGSIPANTTFETMVSKAHSILNEMDCESETWPTHHEQPALQLSDENVGPTSIDETIKGSLRSPSNPSGKRSSRSSSIFPLQNMIVTYLKHVR